MNGLLSLAIAAALGVPVEFRDRGYLKRHPVATMVGFGSHYQPPGTWSDDTSLTLCTAESLLNGFDPDDMGRLFVRWLDEGYWTFGRVFDVGGSTANAISRLSGVPATESGGTGERENGNGSLMRILPVAVCFANQSEEEMLDALHRASAITYAHPRSMMACGSYGLLVRGLASGLGPAEAYAQTCVRGKALYRRGVAGAASMGRLVGPSAQPESDPAESELPHFSRFLSGDLASATEDSVESGGSAIHTLEASVWCLLTTQDFATAVLKAVNLGGDIDTTGAVTGGLAGLYYGEKAIPSEWLRALARREDIEDLARRFAEAVTGQGFI
jgi:ADP-ribosylglycohydrolase